MADTSFNDCMIKLYKNYKPTHLTGSTKWICFFNKLPQLSLSKKLRQNQNTVMFTYDIFCFIYFDFVHRASVHQGIKSLARTKNPTSITINTCICI